MEKLKQKNPVGQYGVRKGSPVDVQPCS